MTERLPAIWRQTQADKVTGGVIIHKSKNPGVCLGLGEHKDLVPEVKPARLSQIEQEKWRIVGELYKAAVFSGDWTEYLYYLETGCVRSMLIRIRTDTGYREIPMPLKALDYRNN